jgi:hypothetical protein
VRGPAHQGHEDDAGRGGRLQDQGEMEFLDISLTKDSSLLLRAIHSPLYLRILKKTILFSCFKNPYKKICEMRRLESIHE